MINKELIATRASTHHKKFYKSYIKNIRFAENRAKKIDGKTRYEFDWFFTYKGKEHRINQYIERTENGEIVYHYEVEEVKEGEYI